MLAFCNFLRILPFLFELKKWMNWRTLIIFIYSLLFERDVVSPSALKVFYRFLTDLVRPSSAFKRHESTFLISTTLGLNRYNKKKQNSKNKRIIICVIHPFYLLVFGFFIMNSFLEFLFSTLKFLRVLIMRKFHPNLAKITGKKFAQWRSAKNKGAQKAFCRMCAQKLKEAYEMQLNRLKIDN